MATDLLECWWLPSSLVCPNLPGSPLHPGGRTQFLLVQQHWQSYTMCIYQTISKSINEHWPQTGALVSPTGSGLMWPHLLQLSKPDASAYCSPSAGQTLLRWTFCLEGCWERQHQKNWAKIPIHHIYPLPLANWMGDLAVKGDQVGKAGLSPMNCVFSQVPFPVAPRIISFIVLPGPEVRLTGL